MPATLTITLPDEVLARLRQRAIAEGKSAEALVAEHITTIHQRQSTRLLELAGSIPLGDGAVADRVDELIGDQLVDELKSPEHV